jgi:hypothetical protein
MSIATAPNLAAVTFGLLVRGTWLAAVVAGCGLSGATSPSSGPTGPASPSAVPAGRTIDHPSGSSDVVLRLTQAGGLMFPEIRALDAPLFTLYGDGRFILKPPSNPPALGGAGPVVAQPAWRTATLTEPQMQALLLAAVDILGTARSRYELNTVMDAPTTTFTINAAGTTKTVEVYALGLEQPDSPDARPRAAFSTLSDLLRNVDQNGSLATEDWRPDRVRGALFEAGPVAGPPVRPWPWPDLAPGDFAAPADPTGLALASRVMTPAQIAKLGITDVGGGVTGLHLSGPGDKKVYAFALRPLLPDETG